MNIISQPKEDIWDFVCALQGAHHPQPRSYYSAMGILKGGRLVAGVIFNHFEECNLYMHVSAIPKTMWVTQGIARQVFDYPFNQLGMRRVTAIMPSRLMTARKFNERLGFEFEGIQRNYYQDDDAVLYGLLRENCRFISNERLAA